MKSAATAEASINSVKDTGMVYKRLITDRDSSNYTAVLNAMPYVKHGGEGVNRLSAIHNFVNSFHRPYVFLSQL